MQETVKDIMSKDIAAVLLSDTARDAAILMYENNIGSVPVVSGKKLQGILTDRDIVLRCIAKGKSADDTKVSEIMSTNMITVTPEETVHDAVIKMSSERIRRLPVVKNGELEGVVSLADIARNHAGPEIAGAISEISMPDGETKSLIKTK